MPKKQSPKEKRFGKFQLKIGYFLLIVSFILIGYFTYTYILNSTNFLEQAQSLVEGKEQFISVTMLRLLILGIVLFALAAVFLPDVWKAFLAFVGESALIAVSVLFLIALVIPDFRLVFRLAFILSAFIIYYAVWRATKSVEEE